MFRPQLFTIYINYLDEENDCIVVRFSDATKVGRKALCKEDANSSIRDIDQLNG